MSTSAPVTPAVPTIKDYLSCENARNKSHAAMYTAIMRIAFGRDDAILIGHHLTFEKDGDLSTENEIPSADTLLFDHAAMCAVFGPADYLGVILDMARVPADERDAVLAAHMRAAGISF